MLRIIYRILFLIAVVVLLAVGVVYAQGHQWMDDPGQLGHYAVGYTSYQFVDQDNGGRPVFVGVWYPVDATDIDSSTPPAEYLTDPYTGTAHLPPTYSTDWEKLGYDPAYEGPTLSKDGPFPLLMFSPGLTDNYWQHLFIGTRLASHGYVVAVTDHWADGQWSWSLFDDIWTISLNRPRDVSFAITQLLAKSRTRGELLFRAIDPKRIAASGHSLGGYATYTLAGGDDLVCDAMWFVLAGQAILPPPANTCVRTPPDPRIKTIISLDGASQVLHYGELDKISVPSLIMGETADQLGAWFPGIFGGRYFNARPHAAINREDSYRADVDGSNHYSYTNYCDFWQVYFNLGVIDSGTLTSIETSWPCANTGVDAVTIPAAAAHEVVTKYMIAFLDINFGHPNWRERRILTPEYALNHTPTVQFFDSERCDATLPDHSYFRYRPFQVSSECDVAQKDPTGWFASQSGSSNSVPMVLNPAPSVPFRPLKKPF
jgi:hypothetical protein